MPMHLCSPATLRRGFTVLLPISLASLCYLYLYPLFHGCAFPIPPSTNVSTSVFPPYTDDAFVSTVWSHILPGSRAQRGPTVAQLRLLVLADPQLEGDTSLPNPDEDFIPRLRKHWEDIIAADGGIALLNAVGTSLRTVVWSDIPRSVKTLHKKLDLLGNDYYLAHIYRTMKWWSHPTHVTVLGDLIGSQWVSDAEFAVRSSRYWNRTFHGSEKVPDEITATGREGYTSRSDAGEIILDLEPNTWSNRIINVAGNHDIGYAGDISQRRIDRFESEFGRANWDVRFNLPATDLDLGVEGAPNKSRTIPSIHLIVLNSLTFDTPALNISIQGQTYHYLNDVIDRSHPVEDQTSFTLLLTHLPLHKEEGVCTDPPYFSFHEQDDQHTESNELRFKAGGLKEQNHLSDYVSHSGILQGIYGMSGDMDAPVKGRGRKGLILTGHDHSGCDVIHYVKKNTGEEVEGENTPALWSWDAKRYTSNPLSNGAEPIEEAISQDTSFSPQAAIREVTLRSMMGEFGGNAGLLSVWFDADPSVQEWKYEITTCRLGVQHIWWAVHVVAFTTFITGLLWLVMLVISQNTVNLEQEAPVSKGQGGLTMRKGETEKTSYSTNGRSNSATLES